MFWPSLAHLILNPSHFYLYTKSYSNRPTYYIYCNYYPFLHEISPEEGQLDCPQYRYKSNFLVVFSLLFFFFFHYSLSKLYTLCRTGRPKTTFCPAARPRRIDHITQLISRSQFYSKTSYSEGVVMIITPEEVILNLILPQRRYFRFRITHF